MESLLEEADQLRARLAAGPHRASAQVAHALHGHERGPAEQREDDADAPVLAVQQREHANQHQRAGTQ